jgi:dihydrofolate reductase
LFDKYKEHRIFIIGGKDIYDMFFDMCKVIHLSIIHVESGGDILFPRTIDESLFTVTKSEILVSRVAETPYQFITYASL